MNKMLTAIALMIAGIMLFSGCAANASNTDASDATISTTSQTTNEPTETAVVTTPTQKSDVTSATTVKETTAATTTAAETTAPAATTKSTTALAATTKSTTAPVATTKAPVATTKATTAATTQATTVATTAAPAYAENCDNIKSLIIAKLQAKGLWFPDAEVKGDDLIQLSVGYANSDDQYATAYVNGKFGQTTSIGATSVSVWIESGYLNMSSTACYLPVA